MSRLRSCGSYLFLGLLMVLPSCHDNDTESANSEEMSQPPSRQAAADGHFRVDGVSLTKLGAENSRSEDRSIEQTVLVDIWGNRRFASEFAFGESRAVVFVFMSTQCPLCRVYLPTLIEMESDFRTQRVQFMGVFPNHADSLLDIASYAQDNDIPFPLVKDPQCHLADKLGARRTPEVVVVDADWTTRYQGAINDQYRAGGRKPDAQRQYLREALVQVLAGEPVEPAITLATGCHIERRPDDEHEPVTFYEHIEPICRKTCQRCHRPGQVGPFPLLTYGQTRRHARTIAEVVEDRRMPPWHGKTDEAIFGKLANDMSLTQDQVDTIVAWVHRGAPAGDPSQALPPIVWPSGWSIGQPDVVLQMDKPCPVPADGVVPYRYFQIPTGFEEDRWVQAVEVRPGNAKVVHHILVHITGPRKKRLFGLLGMMDLYGSHGERAKVMGQYVSGDSYSTYPPDHAMRIPAHATLTLEIHYTPNGKATSDRSSVGLVFADRPPQHEVKSALFTKRGFTIPAYDPHVRLTNEYTFSSDSRILALKPHMHLRGKHWRFELNYPDGRREAVLSVPQWDYNWQAEYRFVEPILVPADTRLIATAIYDNSPLNPNNPDPSANVTWGLQNGDEMMHGRLAYIEVPQSASDD